MTPRVSAGTTKTRPAGEIYLADSQDDAEAIGVPVPVAPAKSKSGPPMGVPLAAEVEAPSLAPAGPAHVRFACPHCGVTIKAPRSVAGKKSNCPECGDRLLIPEPAAPRRAPGEIEIVEAAAKTPSPDVDRGLGPLPVTPAPLSAGKIRFFCSTCGAVIRAPKAFAGKKSRCPACKQGVRIPMEDEPSAVPAAKAKAGAGSAPRKDVDADGIAVDDSPAEELGEGPSKAGRAPALLSSPGTGAMVLTGDDEDEEAFELAVSSRQTLGAALEYDAGAVQADDDGSVDVNAEAFIRFNCGACNSAIRAPKAFAGKKSRCPGCKQRVVIPVPAGPAKPEESVEIQVLSAPPPKSAAGGSTSGWEDVRAAAMGGSAGPKAHIRFDCPECGATIKAPAQFGGKKSRCPGCKQRVVIPRKVAGPDPNTPAEIELMPMSAADEARVTETMGRQTRGNTVSGSLLSSTLTPPDALAGTGISNVAGELPPESGEDVLPSLADHFDRGVLGSNDELENIQQALRRGPVGGLVQPPPRPPAKPGNPPTSGKAPVKPPGN